MRSSGMAAVPLAPMCLVVVTSCTQATLNRSAADILYTVILAGGAVGSLPHPTSNPTPSATHVIGTAEQYIGVPYRWGGSSPEEGFDCSGYVRYVYAQQGVRLPRTSREQAGAGEHVPAHLSHLRQGDLMLFAESRQSISHVAIYAGDGRIIHSSSSGGGVRYDELGTRRGRWFANHMVAARRLAVDGRSLVQPLEMLTKGKLPLDPPDHAPPP